MIGRGIRVSYEYWSEVLMMSGRDIYVYNIAISMLLLLVAEQR